MAPILEFRDVSFARAAHGIFEHLNLSVQSGEIVALLGPNGVGKTTLLRLAAGLLTPSSGSVSVSGRELPAWSRRELAETVALVPQELEVPFAFSVEQIVAQGRVPHLGWLGRMAAQDRAVVEEAMEAVDILPLRDRVFAELSGGERQRVKLAIGLAQQAQLMLLDEPTQHLDLGRQIELTALLRKLQTRGITQLVAVHDLPLARELCRRAILLTPHDGVVVGDSEELLRPEWLQKAFEIDRSGWQRYLAPRLETSSVEPRLLRPSGEHTPRRRHRSRRSTDRD